MGVVSQVEELVRVGALRVLGRVAGERAPQPRRQGARTRIAGAIAAALALGCGGPRTDERFVEPTSGRSYRVIAPEKPAGAGVPVLFALHAYATEPAVLVDAYALVRLAVAERGYVLVVPEGLRDAEHKPHWNASPACCGVGPRHDDLTYLRAVLRDVGRHYAIDRRRVFAIGVSNGAFMAQRWAATTDDLAAVVSICGAFPGEHDAAFLAGRPVSLLHVHGSGDAVVRYQGGTMNGAPYPSARAGIDAWRARSHASSAPVKTRRRTLFFEPVAVERFDAPEARVALWTVEGGDHGLRALRFFAPELVAFLSGS